MSLQLVREFTDKILTILDGKELVGINEFIDKNMYGEEKLERVKGNMRTLNAWLKNEEARRAEADKPREAMWQRLLEIEREIKEARDYTASSRSMGYYSIDNHGLLVDISMYKPNGEQVYFIVKLSYRNGKVFDDVTETVKRKSKFWEDLAGEHNTRHVIVRNYLYTIGDQKESSHHNGFAGTWFYIQFDDGELVKTCDLWGRGTVPPYYRKRLKNNAKFLSEDEFKALTN